MKKTLIAVAAAAALATSSAFAEVTFGAWTKGILVPIANNGGDKKDFQAGLTQSWGGAARTAVLGVNWVSEDEMAGATFEIRAETDWKIKKGDRSVLWLKPIDMLKLSFGYFDGSDNELREGNCGTMSWDYLRGVTVANSLIHGDDGIFDGKSGDGFMAYITPIEGLKIVANIPFMGTTSVKTKWIMKDAEEDDEGNLVKGDLKDEESYVGWAWDAYKQSMVNVAYTIADVGTLKAGVWGKNDVKSVKQNDGSNKKYEYTARIGVAFDLKAVENLDVAVGAKFDIGDKEYTTYEISKDGKSASIADTLYNALITAKAAYNITDALTVSVSGGVGIFKNSDIDPQFAVGGGASYVIMDGLTAMADVYYLSEVKADLNKKSYTVSDDALSFAVGIQKSIGSNAALGVGFEGMTNGHGFNEIKAGTESDGSAYDGFIWCVPVMFTASF